MNKEQRLIYITEQKLLGYFIIFKDRWDHHLALEALERANGARAPRSLKGREARRRFDAFVRTTWPFRSRQRPVHLVLDYLASEVTPKYPRAAVRLLNALEQRDPNYFT